MQQGDLFLMIEFDYILLVTYYINKIRQQYYNIFLFLRFCLEHGLPEAHGCGDAARRAARQQISRDGQLYSGSGRPDKKPDAVRKAQLQRKLDKKMSDLEDQRKSKPKKS